MPPLDAHERAYLLRLARASAARALGSSEPLPAPLATPRLAAPGACFVTLKQPQVGRPGAGLRGCLGTLEAREPLAAGVARLAADTVTDDPRFRDDPVTLAELPELRVGLSVLHPARALADPLDFVLGADGIVVEGQGSFADRHGVYLPQVATEWSFSKEEFLASCCKNKAGLPPEAWRDPRQCRVLAFRAEVFGEPGAEE